MRRSWLLAGAGALALSGQAYAQVAVRDDANLIEWGTSIANEVKAYALQAKQYIGEEFSWATQAQQYAVQGQQYLTEATQLAAFVHDPNLGAAMGLLNAAGLGNSLPVSPYAVMGVVNGVSYGNGGIPNIAGVLGSLSGLAGQAYTANHVYTPADGTWASQQSISTANSIAGTQGTALAAYGDLRTHAAALQAMRDRLASATTPKDVQDAQAEIALEQTWTANQQAQIAAVQSAYAAQADSRAQQEDEKITQSLDADMAEGRAAGIIP
jgi:hypothetical protein